MQNLLQIVLCFVGGSLLRRTTCLPPEISAVLGRVVTHLAPPRSC